MAVIVEEVSSDLGDGMVVGEVNSLATAHTTPCCADEGCNDEDHHHDEEDVRIPPKGRPPKTKRPINYKLAISLILGDGFHNFADGIFLGNAFLLCSRSVAYAIVGATIYHELAQELADYFLLTTHCGLKPLSALCLNFLSGLSVVLGVVVIFALPIGATATGCILAISAGVYVYIAASECLPRIEQEIKGHFDRFSSMLCFTLGAVPIGLVLLSHGHCEA
jgi:zinc transporter ZupT